MAAYNFMVTDEDGNDITDYVERPMLQRTVGKATVFSFQIPSSAPNIPSEGEYITVSFSDSTWKFLILPREESPHVYDMRGISDFIFPANNIFSAIIDTMDVDYIEELAFFVLYFSGAYSYIKPNYDWLKKPESFLPDDTGSLIFNSRPVSDILNYLAALMDKVLVDVYDSDTGKWYLEFRGCDSSTTSLTQKKHIINYSYSPDFDIPPNVVYLPKHGLIERDWESYERYGFWKTYIDNTEYVTDEEAMRQAQMRMGGKHNLPPIEIEIDDIATDIDIGEIVTLEDGTCYIVTDIIYNLTDMRRKLTAYADIPPLNVKKPVAESDDIVMMTGSSFLLYAGVSDALNSSEQSTEDEIILNASRLEGVYLR